MILQCDECLLLLTHLRNLRTGSASQDALHTIQNWTLVLTKTNSAQKVISPSD